MISIEYVESKTELISIIGRMERSEDSDIREKAKKIEKCLKVMGIL